MKIIKAAIMIKSPSNKVLNFFGSSSTLPVGKWSYSSGS